MRKSPVLAKFNTIPLPIKAPYHAPHLFNDDDIESILSTTSHDRWAAQFAAIPTISGATGELIWAANFRSLLRAAVEDILINPLRWDKLIHRLSFVAGSARGMPVVMHQIGVSAKGTLRAAVKQGDSDAQFLLGPSRSLPQSDFFSTYTLKLQATARTLSSSDPTGRPENPKSR